MAMTTSVTRSRRGEGLHPLSHPKVSSAAHRLLANAKSSAAATAQNKPQFAISPPRAKRPLDAANRDFDSVVTKKPRLAGIAVEIPARSSLQARIARESGAAAADAIPQQQRPAPTPTPPAVTTTTTKSTVATGHNHPNPARAAAHPSSIPPSNAPSTRQQQPTITKHQEKVNSVLKHELNRLQPNAPVQQPEQGRKLRSQEATRFKSELSAYFPEYDEVIGNDPKETHLLNVDTPILVIPDDIPTTTTGVPGASTFSSLASDASDTYPVRSYSDSLFTNLSDAQRIDFSFLTRTKAGSDPLPDSVYEPSHRKAERMERCIRNTEKGRAQHEKDQIIRLLDGLQGHDWLRVMGVSGITESKKKKYLPAREHFIKGCKCILEKFRRWAAEEKRKKKERDRLRGKDRQAEKAEQQPRQQQQKRGRRAKAAAREEAEAEAMEADQEDASDSDGLDDDSDVDASVAKQLREEALAAAAAKKRSRRGTPTASAGAKGVAPATAAGRGRARGGKASAAAAAAAVRPSPAPSIPPPVVAEPEPPKEFTSFFRKKYQREAALSASRRRGRNVLAFGVPVPDMEERDFELPKDLFTEEMMKAHERKKRRERRARK